jgi:hypothetical protein
MKTLYDALIMPESHDCLRARDQGSHGAERGPGARRRC